MSRISFLTLIFPTLIMVGCGGGGGGSDEPNVVVPPPVTVANPVEPAFSSNGLDVFGAQQAIAGDSVGFAVRSSDNQSIRSVQWTQTSGPNVTLLAAHTQAIGFDALEAGNYQFNVSVTRASGSQDSAVIELDVVDDEPSGANIRLDHVGSELGRVSLRVDTNIPKVVTDIDWEQLAGPNVSGAQLSSDTTNGPTQEIYFNAPSVANDEPVLYQATITFDDGSQAVDQALVMIKDININTDGLFANWDQYPTTDMQPYRANSPYANALRNCLYNNDLTTSCSFNQLPLIGQMSDDPSVEDILQRTIVSHPWMGDRFAEFLTQSTTGSDMLKLLRATTGVVISYDVRPAFYYAGTGAIYLDARYFWRTPEERDTLNTAPDYRSSFGNDLTFTITWRYAKDNAYYYPQPGTAASLRQSRDFDKLEASLAWLMYHELAHANDYFPSTAWSSLSGNDSPYNFYQNNDANSITLENNYPLQSQQLVALADVSFSGETATATQKAYQAEDIAEFFKPDVAPAYYSYSTRQEDYATLFERFMMLYRLGVNGDVGIFDITDNNPSYLVTWGQRDRVNDPSLQQRTRFVVERVLPQLNVGAIQQQLPSPQLLQAGQPWSSTVSVDGNQDAPQSLRQPVQHEHQFAPSLTHDHLRLPPKK